MKISILMAVVSLLILAVGVYVLVLLIRALRKYIRSEPVRKEKAASARSLGEVLKRRRTECKMTQEFVAEALGVSRQAVSKWESGDSLRYRYHTIPTLTFAQPIQPEGWITRKGGMRPVEG